MTSFRSGGGGIAILESLLGLAVRVMAFDRTISDSQMSCHHFGFEVGHGKSLVERRFKDDILTRR